MSIEFLTAATIAFSRPEAELPKSVDLDPSHILRGGTVGEVIPAAQEPITPTPTGADNLSVVSTPEELLSFEQKSTLRDLTSIDIAAIIDGLENPSPEAQNFKQRLIDIDAYSMELITRESWLQDWDPFNPNNGELFSSYIVIDYQGKTYALLRTTVVGENVFNSEDNRPVLPGSELFLYCTTGDVCQSPDELDVVVFYKDPEEVMQFQPINTTHGPRVLPRNRNPLTNDLTVLTRNPETGLFVETNAFTGSISADGGSARLRSADNVNSVIGSISTGTQVDIVGSVEENGKQYRMIETPEGILAVVDPSVIKTQVQANPFTLQMIEVPQELATALKQAAGYYDLTPEEQGDLANVSEDLVAASEKFSTKNSADDGVDEYGNVAMGLRLNNVIGTTPEGYPLYEATTANGQIVYAGIHPSYAQVCGEMVGQSINILGETNNQEGNPLQYGPDANVPSIYIKYAECK